MSSLLIIYLVSVVITTLYSIYLMYNDWSRGLDTTLAGAFEYFVLIFTPVLNTWFLVYEVVERIGKDDWVVIKGKDKL